MPTATPFNNLITFSRGSNATVTGSNGLIQWAPSNFITFSEQFDNAAWQKLDLTATPNTAVAPDGTRTADALAGNGTNTSHTARFTATASGALQHVFSVYLKQGTERYGYLYTLGRVPTDDKTDICYFDLQAGVITLTSGAGSGATMSAVGDGWYRITLPTSIYPSSINIEARVGTTSIPNQQSSTTTGTVLAWGAQLELGSTATAYNPTTVKNLLGFSEAFDNVAWTKTRASIVTGAQANPVNGLFNAQKLMEDTTATNTHGVSQTFTATSTTTPYTFSIYAKAAGRTILWLIHANATNVLFDLANGTCDVGGVITNVGGGWYRCSVTANAPDLLLRSYNYRLGAPGTNYTGDGNSGVYIYGAQLSDSASLDPYVPTPGAAPSSTAFYGPRFDFDPVTLQPRGLLVEEQRTNGNLYSEDLSNAYWTAAAASVVGGNVAPSGDAVAYRLVENTANAAHQIGRLTLVAAANATVHTMSFYVKPAGRTRIRLYIYGFNNYTAVLDLVSKTVVSATGGTAPVVTFTNVANGYIRIVVTDTTTASELQFDGVSLVSTGTTFIYTGDGVSGVILWGFQREVGAFATSYIPTVASTVTRSADVATISGQNFGQWYAGGQGTFLFEGNWLKPSSGQVYVLANGSSNRYIYDGNAATPTMTVQSFDGTNVLVSNVNVNGTTKIGSSYQTAVNKAISVNGSTAATGAYDATAWSTNTALRFGEASFSGYIRSINYIPARVADFQLQALTELPLVPTLDLDFLNNLYEA